MIYLDTGKNLVVFLDRSVIVKFPPEYLINSVSMNKRKKNAQLVFERLQSLTPISILLVIYY